ncbi:hypothetical protein [Actinomadura sp. 9N215]|uniref:hypothetical protein n=1 Tax=Actinomadura sp. 9N215 TaxID=3375150 RepID=UPI0037AD0BE1
MEQPRRWWQSVLPADWIVFALPEDLVRERYTALLAALEELSTRCPMASLDEIAAQARSVGFHDPLPESELLGALDQLAKWGFAEPFRDYTAPVRDYQGVIVRQEAWALTRKGRGIVAAVRAAGVDTRRALQLPSRLLDNAELTIPSTSATSSSAPWRTWDGAWVLTATAQRPTSTRPSGMKFGSTPTLPSTARSRCH